MSSKEEEIVKNAYETTLKKERAKIKRNYKQKFKRKKNV
jgi:hypothetical protein|tara:strand:+ start:118 stop:234 length:117 start_codon:yes stop_codon:yes gene_type:complete